jgi:hypothetical protein
MTKGARECVGIAAQSFVGFLTVETRRKTRKEQEGLARMGMKPKKYKESRR